MINFGPRMTALKIAMCTSCILLLCACAPGTMIPQINTLTPASPAAATGCQGIQLESACDPRPTFEEYANNGQFEEFAWDLFLYMSWPALAGQRGVPDPNQDLTARQMTTWETWLDLRDVIVITGTPAVWSSPVVTGSGFFRMDAIPQIDGNDRLQDTINDPPLPSLFGLRMNEAVRDYIVQENLFTIDGQLEFVNDKSAPPLDFPRESIEIKSTWIVLNEDVCNASDCPYHVADARLRGSQPGSPFPSLCPTPDICVRQAGLTGLHIMSKVQDNWFWATFEHVDNQTNTNAPLVLPTHTRAQQVTEQMHALLAGTVWENYILRGAQWDFVDPQGDPTLLANTQIETAFQATSSCITCHAMASRGSESEGFLSFFQSTPSGIEGWVGQPPWQLYCEDGESIVPDGGIEPQAELFCEKYGKDYLYRATDYAWVLRLAFRMP